MTKTGNILIVDDNKYNLFYLSSLLENENYNTISTNSGKQAFTSLENNIPDLILLDINMPEMSGFEVCKKIKQNKILTKIPIIFLTGASEKHAKLERFKLGAVDYITKPYEGEELLARVKTHIDLFFLNKKLNEQTQQLKQKNKQYAILNKEYSTLDVINERIIKELKEAKRITEESEEKLIQSEERFRKLSDLTFEGILIQRKGFVIDINKAFTKMCKCKRKKLIGNNIIDLIIPDKYRSVFKEKIAQEHMLPYELEMLQEDGNTIPVEIESLELQYNEESLKVIAFRDLTEKKEQEKQVLNAMIEAEEKERERFSSELHDGLGPLLSVLKMYFQALVETNDKDKIEIIKSNANQNIDEAISAVDEISNNITPRTLRAFGFKAAIRTFIGRLNNLDIVNIDFYCNFEVRIELNIETLVYRIITELINNTLKYAQATKIDISAKLNKTKDNLSVHYTDNGIGFNFANTINLNKGLGLVNIQQRIKVLGSFLEYKTKPNEGVDVYFECEISKLQ